jgi:misacylated tRNA(Ala) deacylase
MAGDRALRFASSAVEALSSVAKLTSSKSEPAEVLKKVNETSEALAESRRNEKKLLLEVAKLESERVKAILRSGKNALVHRSSGGVEFINKVIGEVGDELKDSGLVVAVAMGEAKESGPVVIAGDKEAVAAMVEKVKGVVTNIKGGGGGNKWQGKVPEWQKTELKEFKALFEQ